MITNGSLGRPDRTGRGVAQLVEHWFPKPAVVSSSLSAPANRLSSRWPCNWGSGAQDNALLLLLAVRVFGRKVVDFGNVMPKSKNKRKNAGKKKPVEAVAAAAATASAASESAAPKVGPIKYVGQVRQEARRVVWPGWPEVWKTTILVMILFVVMGLFFFVVDWALANIVQLILGLGA